MIFQGQIFVLLKELPTKGGFYSEGNGGFLLCQKNIPNLYPKQKFEFSTHNNKQLIQIFCL